MSKATDKWFRILKGIPLNEQASAEQLVQTFKAAYKNKTGDDYKDEKWLQQYAEKNPKGLAGEIERMGGAVGKPAADKEKLKKLMARGQRCNRAGFKGFGHEDVGDVKAALGKADYKVSEGNKYGIETLKAVIAFQKEKGLKVDGCVGPKTSGALGIEIKKPRTKIAGKEGKCRYKKRGNTRRTREFMQSSGFDYTEGQRGRIKIDPGWQKQNITRTKLHTGKTIKIHRQIATLFEKAFKEASEASGYTPRSVQTQVARHILWDSSKPVSNHSYGMAIDFNPRENPYGANTGKIREFPEFINIMNCYGFLWGGDWSTPDDMHFEFDITKL